MVAAIAHEISNPLGAVTNLLFLVKGINDLPESARQYLDMADAELRRITQTPFAQRIERYSGNEAKFRISAIRLSTRLCALCAFLPRPIDAVPPAVLLVNFNVARSERPVTSEVGVAGVMNDLPIFSEHGYNNSTSILLPDECEV
jgi:hypothetical protein